jgi:hypothetical protein
MNHRPDARTLNQKAADKALARLKQLLEEGCGYAECCDTMNSENYRTIKGKLWTVQNLKILVFRLRHKCASFYAISQRRANLQIEPIAS